MESLKKVIAELMVLVIGIMIGCFMHGGVKAVVLGIAALGIMHIIWDMADDKARHRSDA